MLNEIIGMHAASYYSVMLVIMIYGTDIGEIHATFGTYMANIWIE